LQTSYYHIYIVAVQFPVCVSNQTVFVDSAVIHVVLWTQLRSYWIGKME